MIFSQALNNAFTFLAEAIYRIFSPHDDAYPAANAQMPGKLRSDCYSLS